ncbi:hypothetical protein BHE74_00026986 [Ensete ventricosum]|nr:hypothetical protein BHE74_00026986 [Ensete ventricosum]
MFRNPSSAPIVRTCPRYASQWMLWKPVFGFPFIPPLRSVSDGGEFPRVSSSRPKQRDASEVGKAEELDEDLERSVNCGGVRKGTYASTVGEGTVHARVGVLLARVAKEMVLQEIDALKFGGGLEAVAIAEERASELEKEHEKTKRERDEALQRLRYPTKNSMKLEATYLRPKGS